MSYIHLCVYILTNISTQILCIGAVTRLYELFNVLAVHNVKIMYL